MSSFEYEIREFSLVEKWSPKKQAEKLDELAEELNYMGHQGWRLHGLHTFDLVGGITGNAKGKVSLTVWERQLS